MFHKTLKIAAATLIFALFVSAPALADACSTARHSADKADKALINRTLTTLGHVLFNDDPASRQKAACENERAFLELSNEALRYHRDVDRACGKRIRWTKCDTACVEHDVRKQEQKVAHECNPARITEAIEQARHEKEERDKKMQAESDRMMPLIEACQNLTEYRKKTATEAEWTGWIRDCNKMDRSFCVAVWFSLEESHVATAGLTCSPTAAEREKRRRDAERMNSPEEKQDEACSLLSYGSNKPGPELDQQVALCNKSKLMCGIVRMMIEDQLQQPNPGLTCPKSK